MEVCMNLPIYNTKWVLEYWLVQLLLYFVTCELKACRGDILHVQL